MADLRDPAALSDARVSIDAVLDIIVDDDFRYAVGDGGRAAVMPDKWLCGNGEMCPACQLRRQAAGPWDWPRLSCNGCDGLGRIAYSPERIVADTLAEARAHNERSAA